MRVVVALGGNALLRPGEPTNSETQRRHVGEAAETLGGLAGEHELIVTHGNGPQVGWLAQQAQADPGGERPLDVLDAETEGMIGYWIEQELASRLPGAEFATLLTQVEVDADDPAFARPSKPIGAAWPEAQARELAARHGWQVAETARGWRRVVPSPEPRALLELAAIRLLVDAGIVVVCGGGGGIPVVRESSGLLRGVEAVIDKDLCAALLAESLEAEALLLLTDVEAVYADWPQPMREPIARASPAQLRERAFEAGSMAPKVEAACRFAASRPGRFAAVGALERADAVLAGDAGTRVEDEGWRS